MKKPVIHKGENGCMNIAFYLLTDDVNEGELVKADHIQLLNGKKPTIGDPILCGTCKNPIYVISKNGWCK